MKTYHWKEYGFIGTVPDFARHLGVCKGGKTKRVNMWSV